MIGQKYIEINYQKKMNFYYSKGVIMAGNSPRDLCTVFRDGSCEHRRY